MIQLGNDIQIILQTEESGGGYKCEGFSGIPVVNPCFIVISTSKSPEAYQAAGKLRQELISTILNLSANSQFANVPCKGHIRGIMDCHAHKVNVGQKLLVLVGDNTTGFQPDPEFYEWADRATRDPHYHLLPVFPKGATIHSLLPNKLRRFNSIIWTNSIVETIPEVLATVGLTASDFRIFISYRRMDTQQLADQLFDALSHENFDVYLDRFRNPPAVNFPVRLSQELSDKSMVLLLESPDILISQWTRFEILFAKLYRLGLLAINVPGGIEVPGIDSDERISLSVHDFVNPKTLDVLNDVTLQEIIDKIKIEHGEALVRRRQMMRDEMENALLLAGTGSYSLGAEGLLHVKPSRAKTGKEYSIWLTTRSPDVLDFHLSDISRNPTEIGIVVGPAMYEPTRKARIDWLSRVSRIKHFDEGLIWHMAQEIAKETL